MKKRNPNNNDKLFDIHNRRRRLLASSVKYLKQELIRSK